MNSPYDLHYWSTQYRQERLREARTKQLQGRLRECRKARSGWGSVSLALANLLSPVRGA
jgi:hypothetical protein